MAAPPSPGAGKKLAADAYFSTLGVRSVLRLLVTSNACACCSRTWPYISSYAARHFAAVSRAPAFVDVSVELLLTLLRSRELAVTRNVALRAVFRWVRRNKRDRATHVPALLGALGVTRADARTNPVLLANWRIVHRAMRYEKR